MNWIKNISEFLFSDADYFRFQYPVAFYFLFLLLGIVVWVAWKAVQQKKSIRAYVNKGEFALLLPSSVKNRNITKLILWVLGLLFLIVGLANMQFGSKKEEVKLEGADIVIALDVSNSMLAEDFKPNRLKRAKNAIGKIVDELGSDRIALVVFAGNAFLQLPLTNDHPAAKMYLESIETDMLPQQGTSLSAALEKALEAFPKKQSLGSKGKAIVLLSDGEDHEEEAISLAEQCKEKGIKLYTLGIGTPEGSTIPELVNGRKVGLKKDKKGSTVVTKLNEKILMDLAEKGGGVYVKANAQDMGLDFVMQQIHGLEKSEFGTQKFTLYEDKFYWFLGVGLFFIVLEMFIFNNLWSKE